ncbi:hypothetical protein HanRHA438_Chr04g0195591 [Helianthus annuus]|nr:hypothetical protein HanRHA438_Chr04g0195591 [Helianthus annuus]
MPLKMSFYVDTTKIEEMLVKNFCRGLGFPILANCYMFDLTREMARATTLENPHIRGRDPRPHEDLRHTIVITGIHITLDNQISVQLKNSWG